MEQEVQQDWAIPLPMVYALIDALNLEWQSADSKQERELVVLLGTYTLIAFCGSFRGNEVFLVDLFHLRKYFA